MKIIIKLLIGFFIMIAGLTPLHAQTADVDAFITNQLAANNVPGCAALAIKDGKVVYEKYFGYANLTTQQPVDTNTIFMLASISKTITGAATMRVLNDYNIPLSASIDAYMPYEVRNPSYPNIPITFHQLLTHTSSIVDNWDILEDLYVFGDSPISLATFYNGYLNVGQAYYTPSNFGNYAPGTQNDYSNAGAALCGYLVERITGVPFNEYCDSIIFEPLCMNNTSWFLSGLDTTLIARPYAYENGEYYDEGLYGYPDYPDGQLRTTARSLSRFAQIHLNNGQFNNHSLLDSATVAQIGTVQFPNLSNEDGLLFFLSYKNGNPIWGHSGGDLGVNTEMAIDKTNNITVVVLTNGDDDNTPILISDRIFDYVYTLTNPTGPTLGCDVTTSTLENQTQEKTLTLYPNPTNGNTIIVNPTSQALSVEVYNTLGVLVYKTQSTMANITLPLANQAAGVYNVVITTPTQRICDKVVKE